MSDKVVCTNKKAYHDYHIESIIEAGMVLIGPEVKSLRAGRANLRDGYAKIRNNEIFLFDVHISPYAYATHDPPDPLRPRKLLLSRQEIKKLSRKVEEKGFALIPIKIYFKSNGKAKLGLALAKGKRQYDKRASIKKKDTDRDLARVRKEYR